MKKILLTILSFYILVLMQTSFLVHFRLWGYVPNLILIVVILLSIFNFHVKLGVGAAFAGGFFLDIFSSHFIGFWILILLAVALFIKLVIQRYVRIPLIQST